jgi:hypothetical protein
MKDKQKMPKEESKGRKQGKSWEAKSLRGTKRK